MIGVIANSADYEVVREFFELFKTPWEFYRSNERYDVLVCNGEAQLDASARLVLVYSNKKTDADDKWKTPIVGSRRSACIVTDQRNQFPLYGESIAFDQNAARLLTDTTSGECLAFLDESEDRIRARIGYDLFEEVRILLSVGQPPANARIPTLELHIALFRDLITGAGIELAEIPPVPDGFPFIACLSHDVDHPSIRPHKWDHTMFGFLYRASVTSLRKFVSGHIPILDLLTNWATVLKLPFVYLGLASDFWADFADRYLRLEMELPSTFFVIPFKGRAGRTSHGTAPSFRGSSYSAQDIANTIQTLTSAGHEVGLHGIDAWIDSSTGSEELQEIRRLTGVSEIGVRMHWLFFDQHSPSLLEEAGAAYDSTSGYNETVGYRAGTTQVYRPFNSIQLLELPMHIMDTALFYPTHLGLAPKQANAILRQMAENAALFGGVLTINWHDRSVAPERLWTESYRALLTDMKGRGAWFSTAGQAVSWFRKRRSARFESNGAGTMAVKLEVADRCGGNLPALTLRLHKVSDRHAIGQHSMGYVDVAVPECVGTGTSL